MPALLLVRHAQASFGAADYDALSETGHAQAAALAADLARRGVEPGRIVAGSLVRQRDTAAALGGAIETDPRWDEYVADDILAHHSSTGARLEHGGTPLSSRDFQAVLEDALLAWIAAGEESPAAETWPAFAARVAAALDAVDGGLVCTSGGVIAAVCVALFRAPPAAFVAFNRVTVNTGVTKLVRGRSGLSLVSFNEHAHLEPALITYR
jgi:broad specificity phosphatase PhoE